MFPFFTIFATIIFFKSPQTQNFTFALFLYHKSYKVCASSTLVILQKFNGLVNSREQHPEPGLY